MMTKARPMQTIGSKDRYERSIRTIGSRHDRKQVLMGGELEEKPKLGMVTQAMAKLVMSFAKQVRPVNNSLLHVTS